MKDKDILVVTPPLKPLNATQHDIICELQSENARLITQRDQVLHLLSGGTLTEEQVKESGLGASGAILEMADEIHSAAMKAPDGFIVKADAALILGCKQRTIDNYMRKKMIPFYKFGRRVLFKRDEVLAALGKNHVEDSTPAATTTEPQVPITHVFRNECWDKVCAWLQICAKSPDLKQRNLATETLRFITKFDL